MSAVQPARCDLRILIVDDDAMSRDYLRTVLRALECGETTDAGADEDIVNACKRSQADVVFLDIELAGGSGIDLIKPILAERPDAFIAMFSAHSTLDNVKQSTAQGARGFIVKPFSAAKIQQVLSNAALHFAKLGKH